MKFLNEDRLDSECKLVVFAALWRNPHATTAELAQELVDYCAYYSSDDAEESKGAVAILQAWQVEAIAGMEALERFAQATGLADEDASDAMALILGARPMPSQDEGRPGL